MIASALAFVLSPLGRVLMISLAIVSAIAFIDRRATYRERARCAVAALEMKLKAREADLAIAKKTAADATAANSIIEGEAEAARRKVSEYETALKAMPNNACALTDDDLRWLRGEGGAGAARSKPAGRK